MKTTLTPNPADDDAKRDAAPGYAAGSLPWLKVLVEAGLPADWRLTDAEGRTVQSIMLKDVSSPEPAKAEVVAAYIQAFFAGRERSKARRRLPVSIISWSSRLAVLAVMAPLLILRGWVRLPGHSPGWLTSAAVFLAGRKRSAVRDEWRSHLHGWPGRGLSRQEQVRAARGFLWSAARFRLQDAADMGWRPIDAVLGSRTLSNLFVGGPIVAMLVAIVYHDGRFGLVADDQDPAALGAFLYFVIKTGRWWRGVKPPEPKRRRVKE